MVGPIICWCVGVENAMIPRSLDFEKWSKWGKKEGEKEEKSETYS